MSIKSFNQEIAKKGIKAEIIKGEGYFYFVGDDVEFSSSVCVNAFCHLTLDQWREELQAAIEQHKKHLQDWNLKK